MPQKLIPGQNCGVPAGRLEVVIQAGEAADFSSFRLYGDGKTRKDEDFIFYGQKANEDGSITLDLETRSAEDGSITLDLETRSAVFSIDLPRLDNEVAKIAFAVTSDYAAISSLKSLVLKIRDSSGELVDCPVDLQDRQEAALILGEIYRRNDVWKFRFIAQGFTGGLKPLAEMYGVEIADAETPSPPPQVNLSKIVLTKASPKVDLGKHGAAGGIYRVNLNWNAGETKKRGLFGWKNGSGVDLDLAAYVRHKDGRQTIVQALGEKFGDLDIFPYVKLLGDDRTGNVADGEWIYINGDRISELEEIIIFTFIYEGAPNWQATNAVTRLTIPGHPEIETRLNEGASTLPMCAIARITNQHGNLGVEKLERYFNGHKDMDKAYGWGFKWQRGSK